MYTTPQTVFYVLLVTAAICAAFSLVLYRVHVLHERELDRTWDEAYQLGFETGADSAIFGEAIARQSELLRTLPLEREILEETPITGADLARYRMETEPVQPDPPLPPVSYRYPPEYQQTGNVITIHGLPFHGPRVHPREAEPFDPSQYTELAPETVQDTSGDSSGVTPQDTWLQDREASVVMWRIKEEEKSRKWRSGEERTIARVERDWWAS